MANPNKAPHQYLQLKFEYINPPGDSTMHNHVYLLLGEAKELLEVTCLKETVLHIWRSCLSHKIDHAVVVHCLQHPNKIVFFHTSLLLTKW